MSNPFQDFSAEQLIERKDTLVRSLAGRLVRLGIEPDYAYAVMLDARRLPPDDRIAVLEGLVEIEAIKYTLAARRIREFDSEEE
ncbi:MAG: hypothetical protein HYU60_05340 [Magnetospirillum sp.]|nr:hypothetical protein [Magnetospirillum sp.]